MKLWRGLGWRIVAAAVLSGLFGLLVAWGIMRRTAYESLQAGFNPYIHRFFDAAELSRCEKSPEAWSVVVGTGGRLDAYDVGTGKSMNPASPPIDSELYESLQAGETTPVRLRFGFDNRLMLLHGATSGPCSVIQATWPPHPPSSHRSPYWLLAGAVIVIALAAALGLVAVVLPLIRRIDRLREKAGVVGVVDGYVSEAKVPSDEIGEVSALLDEAHARIRADAKRLEERQTALERYLTDIAHDLRTPIASMQLALEQAASESRAPVLDELLRGLLRDVVYLGALTENLRLACRLRDGWDPFGDDARVDLADVADRVASRARYFAKNRGISLEIARPDAPVFARCHPTAAEQVVANLVENAVAYGDPGGHVAVVLTPSADRFSLVVADDGPGVQPSELPKLTERTFRSDEARQRDPRGSGLGLAISTEVCAACHWSLRFEPQTPRGLRVVIEGVVCA
jgi:signal transduction histidine kinase